MCIFWPDKITNYDLWKSTDQEPIQISITRRKWRWIGHTLRKPVKDITRQALGFNTKRTRKRGRPGNTWRKTIIHECETLNKSWCELKELAVNKKEWNSLIENLCKL